MLHALSAPWRAYRRLLAVRVNPDAEDWWSWLCSCLGASILLLSWSGRWPWAIPVVIVWVHLHWALHWWDFLVKILFGRGVAEHDAAVTVTGRR